MRKIKWFSLTLAVVLAANTIPAVPVTAAPEADSTAAAEDTDQTDSLDEEAGTGDAPAVTQYIYIRTAQEFINFAEKCHLDSWSADKTVILEDDIDLSGTSFDMIPVFAGVFDGNGHTIQGFRPSDQGYIVGLFRYIREGGTVQDLTLKGNIQAVNEKECIGSLCGVNYGTIKNCHFSGIVNGQSTVGGIAGINEASGSITRCSSDGHIMGYYSTGGIAGTNHGIITFSSNTAGINDNSSWVEEDDEMGTGLFFSFQTTDDSVELFSGVDAGGIAGYSDGIIERCSNHGRVGYEHTGYNIGGIAGRQSGALILCTNDGEIYGRKDVGGIAGQMEPDIEIDEGASLRNAVNKLHDLIDKTIRDMQDSKNAIKSDLDDLSRYGDGALSSGDAVAGQLTDFVDDNVEQVQAVAQRLEHIIDLLPDIMDDMSDCGDALSQLTDTINQLMKDLDFSDALKNNPYDETDYQRLALLTTVGGSLTADPLSPDAGASVTVTAVPEENYQLDKILVNGTDAALDGNTATFVMPEENVRVEAYFSYQASAAGGLSLPLTESSAPESDILTSSVSENSVSGNKLEAPAPTKEIRSGDASVRLQSNIGGSASCTVDETNTATLTITPARGFEVQSSPTVTDDAGGSVSVTALSDGQYTFTMPSSGASVTVSITFTEQTQQSAADTSMEDLRKNMQKLRESSEQINRCIETINKLMFKEDGSLKKLSELNANEQEQLTNAISEMTTYLEQMSAAAAAVLSDLSSLYNILDPYIRDAMEAVGKDISLAMQQIQSMISSLRNAYSGIRGIVGYIGAQPDVRFATLGAGFDADREALHSQLLGISDSLKNLSNTASQYSDQVNEDLRAVNDQLNIVFNLLADHLTDTSELSVEELYENVDESEIDSITTGRVDYCTNNGIIKGDINIGGIAGAMSIDEEDPEDNAAGSIDYQVGRRFITKCLITHGVNNGYITAKKDGAGGIVGYMKHGIVTDCESYGSAESTEGDYVGGIAGESLTDIRRCYSLCSVSGGKNIGGIAGYANTLKDCRAIVSVDASIGQKGAVAGEVASMDDGSVSENYYVGDSPFGIDNISYAGIAQPVSYNELLTTPFLPTRFWHLTVTYRVEDTYLGTQELKFGESLADLNYPKIPDKDGCYGVWPDYSDRVMTGNLLVEGSYEDIVTVVESSEKEEPAESGETADIWQKPYALVEETFTQDTVLNVTVSDRIPPDEAQGRDHVIYDVTLENGDIDAKETFAVRLLNPYENDVQVYGLIDDGWTKLDGKTRGQYIQVEMTGPEESFCIVAARSFPWIAVVIAAVGAAVLFLTVRRLSRRAKKKLAGAHQAPQMK